MKYVFWVIKAILFVAFFGFALKNMQGVTLHFFFDKSVDLPLALLLGAFLFGGAMLGILAMVPMMFRHRRNISRQKKTIATMEKNSEARLAASVQPPQPDSFVSK